MSCILAAAGIVHSGFVWFLNEKPVGSCKFSPKRANNRKRKCRIPPISPPSGIFVKAMIQKEGAVLVGWYGINFMIYCSASKF